MRETVGRCRVGWETRTGRGVVRDGFPTEKSEG